MTRFILSLGLCLAVIAPGSAVAQMNAGDPHVPGAVGCTDSPTPGRRPPDRDCAILLHKNFATLPDGLLVWRFENFPTTEAARGASTPASVVVEAGGKVWLITLAAKGGRTQGATFVAESDLLPPIPSGPSYEIVVSEANLGPAAKVMAHTHSGPETWFLLTGEQCVELPDRVVRVRAGQTASAPAETPMKLNVVGPEKRDAIFFLIVHDSSKSWNTFVDWQDKSLCQQ
jgi:quercetin dioxygenase-like cupin family protein